MRMEKIALRLEMYKKGKTKERKARKKERTKERKEKKIAEKEEWRRRKKRQRMVLLEEKNPTAFSKDK